MWTLIAGILIGALAEGCLVVFVLMLRSWGERHSGDGPIQSEFADRLTEHSKAGRWFVGLDSYRFDGNGFVYRTCTDAYDSPESCGRVYGGMELDRYEVIPLELAEDIRRHFAECLNINGCSDGMNDSFALAASIKKRLEEHDA
jgi:hypothetical protein